MKTHNWQTKALTLFIAVAALWLTAACTNADTASDSPPALETAETSIQEATEAPTEESTQTPTVATPTPQVGCTHETPGLRSWLNTTEEEYVESLPGAWWFPLFVFDEYKDLFWRQPNVYDVSTGQLRDNQGELTQTWGVMVWVTEKVDQTTLPPEDRIPATLDDIQIRILDTEPPQKVPESNCDYSKCGVNQEKGDENMTNPNTNQREEQTDTEITTAEMIKVQEKYKPLFMRQPDVHQTGVGRFTDENDEYTGEWGIVVTVTKKVDQSTLPPEDRIPDCLEGIPVQIEEREPRIFTTGSTQKGDN